jgi:hypothetical protein
MASCKKEAATFRAGYTTCRAIPAVRVIVIGKTLTAYIHERGRLNRDGLGGVTFSAGIDVPDARCSYHFDLPPSLTIYIQERGRLNRDGLGGVS